eukprot:CAMPEP_0197536252 /NCGR_PEP_ID=MMETSP1318-20131121/53428_1 /TAXON_ID=552666 /ORGANISM="Partenskyella glossopodia, Strain RCC365" /LENGTH=99 /DNA_ID=CAMNT_0043094095 /DNA_START=575 /DNA_END=874 /DNA_ORIENTATION=-
MKAPRGQPHNRCGQNVRNGHHREQTAGSHLSEAIGDAHVAFENRVDEGPRHSRDQKVDAQQHQKRASRERPKRHAAAAAAAPPATSFPSRLRRNTTPQA